MQDTALRCVAFALTLVGAHKDRLGSYPCVLLHCVLVSVHKKIAKIVINFVFHEINVIQVLALYCEPAFTVYVMYMYMCTMVLHVQCQITG